MNVNTEKAKKNNRPKTEDEMLDEALDDTFPASDPPSMTEPTKTVRIKKPKKEQPPNR